MSELQIAGNVTKEIKKKKKRPLNGECKHLSHYLLLTKDSTMAYEHHRMCK